MIQILTCLFHVNLRCPRDFEIKSRHHTSSGTGVGVYYGQNEGVL